VEDRKAAAIEFATRQPERFSDLLGAHDEGWAAQAILRARFHAAFAAATRATYVLAIGEELAHSAFHVAAGFGHTGHLDLVVADPPLGKSIAGAITRHSLDERIRLHNANPTSVVPNLNGPFDLLIVNTHSVDADSLYEHCVRLLRVGGSMTIELAGEPARWLEKLATDERLYVHVPDTESPVIAVRRR
jgi:hypothetical protein